MESKRTFNRELELLTKIQESNKEVEKIDEYDNFMLVLVKFTIKDIKTTLQLLFRIVDNYLTLTEHISSELGTFSYVHNGDKEVEERLITIASLNAALPLVGKSNEQKREEAIREVWGESFLGVEKFYPYGFRNGFCHVHYVRPEELGFKERNVDFFYENELNSSDGFQYWAPIGLKEVLSNNGWTRIERGKTNLPKSGAVKYMLYEPNCKGNQFLTVELHELLDIVLKADEGVFTHFRAIENIIKPRW